MQKVQELLESFRPGTYIYQPFQKQTVPSNVNVRSSNNDLDSPDVYPDEGDLAAATPISDNTGECLVIYTHLQIDRFCVPMTIFEVYILLIFRFHIYCI